MELMMPSIPASTDSQVLGQNPVKELVTLLVPTSPVALGQKAGDSADIADS
jgi:hypothetical protein